MPEGRASPSGEGFLRASAPFTSRRLNQVRVTRTRSGRFAFASSATDSPLRIVEIGRFKGGMHGRHRGGDDTWGRFPSPGGGRPHSPGNGWGFNSS